MRRRRRADAVRAPGRGDGGPGRPPTERGRRNVDDRGRLEGIVSRRDILRLFLQSDVLADLIGRLVRRTDGVVDVDNHLTYARDDTDDKVPRGPHRGVFERSS